MKIILLEKILVVLIVSFFCENLTAQTIEYSTDGQTLAVNWNVDLAVGTDFSQILFYDVQVGKIKSSLNTEELSNRMLFSGNGKTLLIADRLTLEKFTLNESRELVKLENPHSIDNFAFERKNQDAINSDFLGLALAPDGKTLYKLYPNFLNAYSFPELRQLPEKSRSIELRGKDELQNEFLGISRDGRFIIESEYRDEQTTFIIKENGRIAAKIQPLKNVKDFSYPRLAAFISQNNQTLMVTLKSGLNERVQLGFWDLKTYKFITNFIIPMIDDAYEAQFYPLEAVAISPDGKKAAARFDTVDEYGKYLSAIAIFDLTNEKTSYIKVNSDIGLRFAEAIVFSPDSKQLTTLSSVFLRASLAPLVEIWNAEDGKKIRQFE